MLCFCLLLKWNFLKYIVEHIKLFKVKIKINVLNKNKTKA